MSNALLTKATGCLVGLAIGDALGAPVEGWSAKQIQEKHKWVDDFLTANPVGTDDTEYAILTAKNLMKYGDRMTPEDVVHEWKELIRTNQFFGGGFSEAAAIRNLKKGLMSPLSGMNNPEMWSDGTAMRVAPIGVYCAGDPEKAVRMAAIDGMVSHAKDGIISAQSVAASVAVAMQSSDVNAVLQAGLDYIPRDSWTYRMIDKSINEAYRASSVQEAAIHLHDQMSIHHYYWVDVGPEAVALAYGSIAAAKGDYKDAVICSVNCGRDADTIAAISGAITGALHGVEAIPETWIQRIGSVSGKCIGSLAGIQIKDIAIELVESIRRK